MEPLNQCHHYPKFGVYRSCGSRDLTLLLYQVKSQDHMIKGTSYGSADVFILSMISRDHMTKGHITWKVGAPPPDPTS